MSRFLSKLYSNLIPYVPGEQPRDKKYIKLNTNESPFPPSPKARHYVKAAAKDLQLYSDPECKLLRQKMADTLGVKPEEVVMFNGSDEALSYAFMTFCDEDRGVAYPDISYGFYSVYANLYGIDALEIPLRQDFTIAAEDYIGIGRTVVIANPNAPTGLKLSLSQIEEIVKGNPDNIVVIDEAYVDFGGESAVALIPKYENLLVIQTFSKSRSMAGARLGCAVGCKTLMDDLNLIRYSMNPYNVNRMTMAAGMGALEDVAYFRKNCGKILENRAWTTEKLRDMGFTVLDSHTNFVLAKHGKLPGKKLYLALKERGILVRHFDTDRLRDYIRVTIGSKKEMIAFAAAVKTILEEGL